MSLRSLAMRCSLACLLLLAHPSHAHAEAEKAAQKEAKISQRAREHFNAGVAYIDDPSGSKWEEAYKEFHAAYAESGSFRILNNIGLCALHLERDQEAIAAYEKYLAIGGKDVSERIRGQVEKDIATLKASLAEVAVKVDEPGAQLLDERETATGGKVVNRYAIEGTERTLGIHPGYHRFTVTSKSGITAVWSFEAEPSAKEQHEFRVAAGKDTVTDSPSSQSSAPNALTPQPGSDPGAKHEQAGLPASFYVGLATTTVFAAATAVTGGLAMAKQSAFDEAKADGDRTKASELKDSGQRYAIFADIALGAAAVSAGLTVWAYFSAPSATPEGATARRSLSQTNWKAAGVSVVPMAGSHSGGISLRGAF